MRRLATLALLPLVFTGASVTAQTPPAAATPPTSAPTIGGAHPVVSPDGTHIVYLSTGEGMPDLYVTSPNGTGTLRLTQSSEEESNPQWSPDGKQIWFGVTTDGASRIFAIGPDGNNRHQIGAVPGRTPTLSPSGKQVLYATGSWTEVKKTVSELDGSNAHPVADEIAVFWNAQWSPDGTQIAFTGKDGQGIPNVQVMSADGTDIRQVTHLPAAEGRAQVPAWSHDGKRLAFQVNQHDIRTAHIWILDLATGKTTKLGAHAEPYLDEVPSWFPDGKRIAFQSDRTGRMEVWVMRTDGSGQRQITH